MNVRQLIREVEAHPRKYLDVCTEMTEEKTQEGIDALLFGRALLLVGRHEEAIGPLTDCFEAYKSQKASEAAFYAALNLSIAYREVQAPYIALNYSEYALDVSYDLAAFSYVIEALVTLGSIYIEMGNGTRALQYYEKAATYENQLKDTRLLSHLYNNYAYALIENNRLEEAMIYYVKAKQMVDQLYTDYSNVNRLILEINIAELYFKMGAFRAAKACYETCLTYAQREDILFLKNAAHLYLSKIAEFEGDYASAYAHYKESAALNRQEEERGDRHTIKNAADHQEKLVAQGRHVIRNTALENRTKRLQETLKHLGRVSEVGRKLVSTTDNDAIYKLFRDAVVVDESVDVVYLALLNASKNELTYAYFEERGKRLPEVSRSVDDASGLGAYAVVDGCDIFIKNFDVEYTVYFEEAPYNPHGNMARHSRSILVSRLLIEGRCIGIISIQSYAANAFNEADFEVFKTLAGFVAIAIENARKHAIIKREAQRLEYLSFRDSLTGLRNRRAFTRDIADYESRRLGVIVGDLNHLKQINDTLGHLVGDGYIRRAGDLLRAFAQDDLLYRIGGDEFALLLPEVTEADLIGYLDAIQESFSQESVMGTPLSIALGYAVKEAASTAFEHAFSEAESRMYAHKASAFKRALL
ncbi:diguanylate cyclase domain-containing protein [Fusibacter sp. JL298sf-3]